MAENVNSINRQTKNSMPTFATGKFVNLQKLYTDGKITAPAICITTDANSEGVVFLDSKGNWHRLLLDRLAVVEAQLSDMTDPTTGEPIKVVEYVEDKVEPVSERVTTVEEKVGYVSMLVSGEGV